MSLGLHSSNMMYKVFSVLIPFMSPRRYYSWLIFKWSAEMTFFYCSQNIRMISALKFSWAEDYKLTIATIQSKSVVEIVSFTGKTHRSVWIIQILCVKTQKFQDLLALLCIHEFQFTKFYVSLLSHKHTHIHRYNTTAFLRICRAF